MHHNLLMVFIKNPVRGQVKTRLAKGLGEEFALQIYRNLLNLTLKVTSTLEVDRQVWYSKFIPDQDPWATAGFVPKIQQGDDLGERMYTAFQKNLNKSYSNIIIIGSDSPEITTSYIEKAFELLENCDAVIGPANDGGYFLLGLKQLDKRIFSNKKWSTSSVFSDTIKDFENLGWQWERPPQLMDLDTIKDWEKIKNKKWFLNPGEHT